MDLVDSLENLVKLGNKEGAAAVAARLVAEAQEGDLGSRRKMAIFVSAMLGHGFGAQAFEDCGEELRGRCRRCQMGVLVGKRRGLSGRMLEHQCPSRGSR